MKKYRIEIKDREDFLYSDTAKNNRKILSRLLPHLQPEDHVTVFYPEIGVEEHFKNYQLHREDGPASVVYNRSGVLVHKLYYLEGISIKGEEKYLQAVYDRNLKKVLNKEILK